VEQVAYSCASLAALRLSSSLYFVAALDVYLVLGSLLARAAVPPFDWKNFVADSLPPTFMSRSCSHCQTSHSQYFAVSGWSFCTTNHRGWSTEQRRYALQDFGDLKSNQGRGIFQMAQRTKSDCFGHSRSISRAVSQSSQNSSGDLTRFAGLVLSFSNIFCDCAFVALMLQTRRSN
jgi:hypothetical protein